MTTTKFERMAALLVQDPMFAASRANVYHEAARYAEEGMLNPNISESDKLKWLELKEKAEKLAIEFDNFVR